MYILKFPHAVWQSFLSIFPRLSGGTMATSQTCCHLPGKMLNSAAECADRARIPASAKLTKFEQPSPSHFKNPYGVRRPFVPPLKSRVSAEQISVGPILEIVHNDIIDYNIREQKQLNQYSRKTKWISSCIDSTSMIPSLNSKNNLNRPKKWSEAGGAPN
jgi:hypothetical protein